MFICKEIILPLCGIINVVLVEPLLSKIHWSSNISGAVGPLILLDQTAPGPEGWVARVLATAALGQQSRGSPHCSEKQSPSGSTAALVALR